MNLLPNCSVTKEWYQKRLGNTGLRCLRVRVLYTNPVLIFRCVCRSPSRQDLLEWRSQRLRCSQFRCQSIQLKPLQKARPFYELKPLCQTDKLFGRWINCWYNLSLVFEYDPAAKSIEEKLKLLSYLQTARTGIIFLN